MHNARTTWGMHAKAARIHLRVDADQQTLLEAASSAAHTSVSAFVLTAATAAAAEVLAGRRAFALDAQAWELQLAAVTGGDVR